MISARRARRGGSTLAVQVAGSVAVFSYALYAVGILLSGFSTRAALTVPAFHIGLALLVAIAFRRLLAVLPPARAGAGQVARNTALALAYGWAWALLVFVAVRLFQPGALRHLTLGVLAWTAIMGAAAYAIVVLAAAYQSARERAADRDAVAVRAELSALRARVEPHFLYNVLETIAGLISSDPHAAEAALTRLGRMFRRVLDDTGSDAPDVLIALDEELALVRDYLQIEQLRLGERLHIIERVADGCGDMAVPPFTVQILVENAVRHGIVPRPEGGTIAVAALLERHRLVLEVSDDGAGAAKDVLIRSQEARGLSMVRARLRAYFGDEARFDVAASPGKGVSVRISIPAVEAER